MEHMISRNFNEILTGIWLKPGFEPLYGLPHLPGTVRWGLANRGPKDRTHANRLSDPTW